MDRGLTLRRAAMAAGVSYDLMQRAENGASPHPENRRKIAALYGLKPTDIWSVDGDLAA